jgi:hypothetical protein
LLEASLQPLKKRAPRLFIFSFNPCFAGSISPTCPWFYNRKAINPVSILVLLEASLQRFYIYTFTGRFYRFNPCFAGSISPTKIDFLNRQIYQLFQSLFCWKHLSNLF